MPGEQVGVVTVVDGGEYPGAVVGDDEAGAGLRCEFQTGDDVEAAGIQVQDGDIGRRYRMSGVEPRVAVSSGELKDGQPAVTADRRGRNRDSSGRNGVAGVPL